MFVHVTMLIYVSKELHVMNLFAGQPYLCDFGADLPACTLDDASESASASNFGLREPFGRLRRPLRQPCDSAQALLLELLASVSHGLWPM